MNDFFKHTFKVDDVKKLYKQLAKQFHPDLGGNEETFKLLNNQYQVKLKSLDNSYTKSASGTTQTYKYEESTETDLMNKIRDILSQKYLGVEVELIGTWLWITGDTKRYSASLKALGLKYNGKRKAWFFTTQARKGRCYSNKDFNSLRMKYGSAKFQTAE
jgi:hypothetical protein